MTNNYFKVKGGLEVPDADDFWIGETLTPSIRPSLLLDFAKGKQLDGRVNFTRDSTATYYDGKATAKAEENLLKYSNDFSNSLWSKTGCSATTNETAPDGSLSAWKIATLAGQTQSFVTQTIFPTITGITYTISVYAKAGTNRNYLGIQDTIYTTAGSEVYFNLSNGTVAAIERPASHTATITAISNGWYRCSVSFTSAVATTGVVRYAACYDSSSFITPDDLGFLYIWKGQLEQSNIVGAYVETTSTSITNYIPVLKTAPVNAPRFNHDPVTGESLGLLIEPETTNYLTYSEDFSGRSIANLAARTANYAVSPNGTLTATRLVENTTANAQRRWYGNIGTVPAFTSATWSVYVKPDANRKSIALYPNYGGNGYIVDFNLVDLVGVGAQVGDGTGSYTIETVGNGWFRLSVTVNFLTEQTGLNYFGYFSNDVNDGNAYYTGDGVSGILIWGEQIELGSTLTSYIPTSGSIATRNVDDCTVTLGSWYNQNEGTIFAHAKTNVTDNNRVVVNAQNGTYNRIGVSTCQAIGYNLAYIGNNYVTQLTRSFGSASTGYRKVALAYANNNSNTALDGNVSTEDTQCTIPAVSQFRIGGISTSNNVLNGHIKKIAYYPKRLSNQELVDMTE